MSANGYHVVIEQTHGTFQGFAFGPDTLEAAREFVADPPDVWRPRPQDRLVIYRLDPVDDEAGGA